MASHVSRRTVLALSAAAACLLRAWPAGAARPEAALLRALTQRSSAGRLGRHYLKWERRDADAAGLALEILRGLDLEPGRLGAVPVAELRRRIRARVRDDFKANRTRVVDGWILSRTEVDLCILAALEA